MNDMCLSARKLTYEYTKGNPFRLWLYSFAQEMNLILVRCLQSLE